MVWKFWQRKVDAGRASCADRHDRPSDNLFACTVKELQQQKPALLHHVVSNAGTVPCAERSSPSSSVGLTTCSDTGRDTHPFSAVPQSIAPFSSHVLPPAFAAAPQEARHNPAPDPAPLLASEAATCMQGAGLSAQPACAHTSHGCSQVLFMASELPAGMMQQEQSWSIDHFTLDRVLHKGYASAVYKATCKASGKRVCVKVYTLKSIGPLQRHQARREIRLHGEMSRLMAEKGAEVVSVVPLYAAFEEEREDVGSTLVMVMAYARGGDLFRATCRLGGKLPEDSVRRNVIGPVLRTMIELHSHGILHRDLKPENLLLMWDGSAASPAAGSKPMLAVRVALGDFGLSLSTFEERAVTRCGTLAFMAPEVIACPSKTLPKDHKENVHVAYGAGADVWSVGVMTFELLTGTQPFTCKSDIDTVRLIRSGVPPFLESAGLSAEAVSFIRTALEKDSLKRPSMRQLLQHKWLKNLVSKAPTSASSLAVVGPAAPSASAKPPASAFQPGHTGAIRAFSPPAPAAQAAPLMASRVAALFHDSAVNIPQAPAAAGSLADAVACTLKLKSSLKGKEMGDNAMSSSFLPCGASPPVICVPAGIQQPVERVDLRASNPGLSPVQSPAPSGAIAISIRSRIPRAPGIRPSPAGAPPSMVPSGPYTPEAMCVVQSALRMAGSPTLHSKPPFVMLPQPIQGADLPRDTAPRRPDNLAPRAALGPLGAAALSFYASQFSKAPASSMLLTDDERSVLSSCTEESEESCLSLKPVTTIAKLSKSASLHTPGADSRPPWVSPAHNGVQWAPSTKAAPMLSPVTTTRSMTHRCNTHPRTALAAAASSASAAAARLAQTLDATENH